MRLTFRVIGKAKDAWAFTPASATILNDGDTADIVLSKNGTPATITAVGSPNPAVLISALPATGAFRVTVPTLPLKPAPDLVVDVTIDVP